MKLELETKSECDALLSIVSSYEENLDDNKKDRDTSEVVSDIKNSIDSFIINRYFGYIGPMKCSQCDNEWMAIFPENAFVLRCQKCQKMNNIPKFKKQGKE